MKVVIAFLSLFSAAAIAASFSDAEKAAKDYLEVESVTVDNESDRSYFFVTDLEYSERDQAGDHPCIRGVVVDKKSGLVVDPTSDPDVQIFFSYSDSDIEGLIVINCAD